ncbi:histidine phosphatase family protein [Salipiger sp. PrR002]|uniref:SixA phosphatase family protein n=1 Tax=Salipiger sp. PrR002 TaxID=2706489 RepID=UPI0013BBD23E|nr:histidine phosphatase family protein [Salipiger sp. PrR002]NDW01941.1 histidine phosphatase family protein [Salipiger sp. PrR002]NDW58981.1 histidine phosphatase family protein [Salipiger sp. PrR004]
MKRLILMRHAKSDWSVGTPDHARPLNDRGRRSAEALGDWLRAEDILPDQVLCSSAARTRETLDLLHLGELPTRFEDRLYLAGPSALLKSLQAATGTTVLMLAHNPGICDFANAVVSRGPNHPRFADYPTGATLVADFDIDEWADARLGKATSHAFTIPRELV